SASILMPWSDVIRSRRRCRLCHVFQANIPTTAAPNASTSGAAHPSRGTLPSSLTISGGTRRPQISPAPNNAAIDTTEVGRTEFMRAADSQDDLEVLALVHARGVDALDQVRDESLAGDLALGIDLEPRDQHEAPLVR